jgi:hypothetical protein
MVIAYFNETWWLVKGESHLDDVLAGKEAPEIDISLRTCKTWSEVLQLWETPEFGRMPWAINPKIITRLRTREHTTEG